MEILNLLIIIRKHTLEPSIITKPLDLNEKIEEMFCMQVLTVDYFMHLMQKLVMKSGRSFHHF